MPFLIAASCALLLAACGGGDPNPNMIPSLDSPRDGGEPPVGPKAPTDALSRLQGLLPRIREAVIEGSVVHGGWDSASSNFYSIADVGEERVKNSPLPAVRARYVSTGYRLENLPDAAKDKPGINPVQNLPQACDIYIVHAPDAQAAATLERLVLEKLKKNEFSPLEPLTASTPKGQADPQIKRMLRVMPGDKTEDAHVAYTLVVGNRFCYALETETRTMAKGPDGKPIEFTFEQRGSSLGGQLLTLVEFNMMRK